VIDVFYKIKAMHEQGVKVHLHCFEYGRPRSEELQKYCAEVFYYPREMNTRFLFSTLPYIVISRKGEDLINRLLLDSYPILFEGLHSCYYLSEHRLKGRQLMVRNHNIEHDYYENLARVEKRLFKRIYFKREAMKLKKFEKVLNLADPVFAISKADELELKKRYPRVELLPAFHPNEKVVIPSGLGEFALYHGNLEVGENNEAALFLVRQVFAGSAIPLIIAGKRASPELRAAIAGERNITLKDNIPTAEIDELILRAQVNVLPTFQATGIKLKLLAALYNGRHCVVNSLMVMQTGLESLCSTEDSAAGMKKEIERVFRIPVAKEEQEKRERILNASFSNKAGVVSLISFLR
jgi:glycosyltransferase involved in cell wall biosynthesis